MNSAALEYLACPVCKGSLSLGSDLLVCDSCKRDYPVIRGIPRLLPDSLMGVLAKQIPEDFAKFKLSFPLEKRTLRADFETETFLGKQLSTMNAFSYEWSNFTQFSSEFTKNEYVRTLAPLPPDMVKGKVLLEAGTGAGLFLEWFSHFGAKHVFAMNLGLDVETAASHAKNFPNVTVVEGDIFNLPFKNKLDFVISHGVVHHLPEPEMGFQKLVSVLNPHGEIFIWVYGKDPIVPVIELIRGLFHKLPKPLVQAACWPLAFPLLVSKVVFLTMNKIPFLKKYAGKVPYNQYAVRNYTEMQCTMMDKLFVPVVNYYDRPELERWFSNAKLEAVSISKRDGNSWSCYGRKI